MWPLSRNLKTMMTGLEDLTMNTMPAPPPRARPVPWRRRGDKESHGRPTEETTQELERVENFPESLRQAQRCRGGAGVGEDGELCGEDVGEHRVLGGVREELECSCTLPPPMPAQTLWKTGFFKT